ncbi:hypothetical protein [Nocardia cyriacigeorgica]|uniref:hypothetical protein n=1 Tax=Nocardia cyriacigeorgica TaxID=135487 RepID=UPI0018932F9A|nr:hypothetical protein [Nocardia cyriacigeorgica]MBF6435332.1 hypothetical protein [Nocardia cyriacigeorgica]
MSRQSWGRLLLIAAAVVNLLPAALTANAVSMAGFLALIPLEQPVGPALMRVAKVDVVGLLLLAGAATAFSKRDAGSLG